MNIGIINIGDELLIGQVVNTNAAWMSQKLTDAGMDITEILTIADKREAIEKTVRHCMKTCDAVLITGGLGPTKDDITKHTLCELFGSKLVENAESLKNIERIFAGRNYPMSETNRRQAWVPECCEVIVNKVGTAPCMWFEQNGKIVVSMPGVPSEMKYLMNEHILCKLKTLCPDNFIIRKNLLTYGIGESFLSDLIESWELSLPKCMHLAYLPQHGMLKLRLTAEGNDENRLKQLLEENCKKLYEIAGQYILGEDMESLQEIVANRLKELHLTLSTAESCTGGSIASKITAMPGASEYYKGGAVVYSNELKEKLLNVSHETLLKHGAVSEETATEMAGNLLRISGSDYALATTGIAGPNGGTAEKPIGTIWIGIASKNGIFTKLLHQSDQRANVIERTCNQMFGELIRLIVKEHGK